MDSRIAILERKQAKKNIPEFSPGDTLAVFVKVMEGGEDSRQEKGKRGKKEGGKEVKERIQKFEGTVIATHGDGLRETVTVRKVSSGIGVERVFLLHSPKIDQLKVMRRGKVRRAKLFYLRGRSARGARITEAHRTDVPDKSAGATGKVAGATDKSAVAPISVKPAVDKPAEKVPEQPAT